MVHDNETADSYRPPPPPPVQFPDRIKTAAIFGVLGAPLVYVLVGIVLTFQPVLIGLLCAVVFVGSFVTLLVRSKDRAPQDDGWDDGAVL